MSMKGKSVIVTGGGRDIGRACVMRLAEAGANVAINYMNSSTGADSAVAEITAAGGKAFALQGDMTSEADVATLVSATVEAYGQLDGLIHVTGGLVERTPLADMTLDFWNHVMALNFTSYMLVARECVKHMRAGGTIVAMASQAGRDGGGAGATAYAASKGAIMTFTRGLAKELGPDIRVNAVCPGMIDTDFHNIHTKPEVRSHVANITPLKREGTSEDVANLAVYLSSDDSAFLTGTNVDINGGLLFS